MRKRTQRGVKDRVTEAVEQLRAVQLGASLTRERAHELLDTDRYTNAQVRKILWHFPPEPEGIVQTTIDALLLFRPETEREAFQLLTSYARRNVLTDTELTEIMAHWAGEES